MWWSSYTTFKLLFFCLGNKGLILGFFNYYYGEDFFSS